MEIIATAMHDDGLFIALGRSLANGHWLGPYSQMTLAKGPGYPFFLALNSWSGLPVSVAHAIFHCAAASLFGWAIARVSGSKGLGWVVFCLTLWHPLFFTRRVVREAIYTGQILLVFGGALYSLFATTTEPRRLIGAATTGLLLGWCWLTREEGSLLVPGLAMLAGLAYLPATRSLQARRVTAILAVIAIGFFAVHAYFEFRNFIKYGAFTGVEFKERNFAGALNALQSVRADKQISYVPVSRATRERIYEVSPAFASLKDYLDPPRGSPWQQGCEFWRWTCGEISGGWFMWALRDAAASKGHYQSPVDAAAFFGRIKAEITSACKSEKLICEQSLVPYMPRVTEEQWSRFPGRLAEAIRIASVWRSIVDEAFPSTGNRAELTRDLTFLNFPLHTGSRNEMPRYELTGWYFSGKADWPTLEVRNREGALMRSFIDRRESPDLVEYFNTPLASRQRFVIEAWCESGCTVTLTSAMGIKHELGLDQLRRGTQHFEWNGERLQIDSADNANRTFDPLDLRIRVSRAIRLGIYRLYSAVIPFLLLLGVVALGVGSLWIRRTARNSGSRLLIGIAASLWVVVATRILALVLIDVSAFPAVDVLYLGPATYIAPIAAVLSLWAMIVAIRSPRAITNSAARDASVPD